ncbi:DUF1062 domain-containing protein [Micromonospora sp. NPDC048898]|uniref:DUF1062 domain-containing protein n=1 Tax=Micromonospora sp. NPDC048898 TaxID=3364260 RepID=UPI0037205FE5
MVAGGPPATEPGGDMSENMTWVVEPVRLPLIRRRCHLCASDAFRTSGKFRVNANHKLLDVWLLALCAGCGTTTKIAVMERMNVRYFRAETLDRLHGNDPELAAEVLHDPAVRRRNHISLDWNDAWRLDTGGSDHLDHEVIDVSVRFAAPIPVRPMRLIADGCGLTRAGVEQLSMDGKLVSAARLSGKLSTDFTFTLERWTDVRQQRRSSAASEPSVAPRSKSASAGSGTTQGTTIVKAAPVGWLGP